MHERQHGRRRHDGGRPPRQHVCVAGECRGHGTYTDRQEALGNEQVAFVDGDVTLNLNRKQIHCYIKGNNELKNYCNNSSVP